MQVFICLLACVAVASATFSKGWSSGGNGWSSGGGGSYGGSSGGWPQKSSGGWSSGGGKTVFLELRTLFKLLQVVKT